MAGETTKLTLTSKPLARLAPIMIWLMLIFFPAILARVMFMQATTMETILQDSMLRQKLSVEIRKYNTALQSYEFITNAVRLREMVDLITQVYNNNEFITAYKQHPVLNELPAGMNTKGHIGIISEIIKKRIGVIPDFIYLIDADPEKCALLLCPKLNIAGSDYDAGKELGSAHSSFLDRINYEKERAQSGSTSIVFEHRLLQTGFLHKMLRTFEPFTNSIGYMFQRYSTNLANNFLIWTMPIITENGTFRFVMSGCAQSSLDPEFILQRTARNLSSKEFAHRVGTSQNSSLPIFYEEPGKLSLVSEIPESFMLQLNQEKFQGNARPVLQISCESAQKSASRKQAIANVTILFYAMLMTFLMFGLSLGKFKLNRSLYKLVAAGFFAGILLPLSAAIWLGICYLSNQKQLKAEAILDLMQQKIQEKEQMVNLQISRNVLFQNAFSHKIARLSDKSLLKLNHQTGFFGQGHQGEKTKAIPENLNRRLFCYTFVKPGLEDYHGVKDPSIQKTDTIQPFFSGVSNDVLYQLGAFSHLPESAIKQKLQKSQLTMGFLDSAIDRQIFTNTFADEQSMVFNNMTTGLSFINGVFWKDRNNRTTGLSLLQSDRRAWINDFFDLIQQQKISQEFTHEGFAISVHFFVTRFILEGQLETYRLNNELKKGDGYAYYRTIAEAVFALTDEIRLNNLYSDRPHLLNASLTNNRQMFIMAYAEPIQQGDFFSGEVLLAIFALLAFISSLVLARGITWVLLKSLPPFQTAIDELSRQNYRWELQLSSGDEFDTLADSFNSITLKLDEKERISRLVSRNVLDAINSGDDQLLKPGGSKVKASILFADLRGFTTITEKHPPQEVVDMLNDYFSLMAEIIENHGGIIDKLIGDAIQAVFYDHECENCARSAAIAAGEMRAALVEFNIDRQARQLFTIDNGVGICTGEVICGRVGSESGKLDATIIGALVNQAARLESLSKHGKKSKIAIDEATSKALGKKFTWKNIKVDAKTSFLELN